MSLLSVFKSFLSLLVFHWPLQLPPQCLLFNSALRETVLPHYMHHHCSQSQTLIHAFLLAANYTTPANQKSLWIGASSITFYTISTFLYHIKLTHSLKNGWTSNKTLHVSNLFSLRFWTPYITSRYVSAGRPTASTIGPLQLLPLTSLALPQIWNRHWNNSRQAPPATHYPL